jgi:hypothetical protein
MRIQMLWDPDVCWCTELLLLSESAENATVTQGKVNHYERCWENVSIGWWFEDGDIPPTSDASIILAPMRHSASAVKLMFIKSIQNGAICASDRFAAGRPHRGENWRIQVALFI